MKRFIFFLLGLIGFGQVFAQSFSEEKYIYPIGADGDKYVISGFIPFDKLEDKPIFANALLWTVENICPRLMEGITRVDVKSNSFSCDWILASAADSDLKNTYYCRVNFRIADGKLVYYVSDILAESAAFVMKKVTPFEKMQPEKKEAHRRIFEDFQVSCSTLLNQMFDYVQTNQLPAITHWEEIRLRKAVVGMNGTECLLAFGKPQTVLESNGEVQWMYTSSFHLFFKNGLVCTVLK